MRWVALAFILLSLPMFIAWLNAKRAQRDVAMLAIGALLFVVGTWDPSAAFVSWPAWSGIGRGISISLIDTLALALIVTRKRGFEGLPFRFLILFYALTLALSMAFSAVPMASSFVVWDVVRAGWLFVAIAGELTRPTALRNLLVGLALGLMFQSGFVIEQKLRGVVQATGSLNHQNTLGMMTELALLPLIAAVLEGERSKLLYGGILGGLIVVAGGGSRGAMGIVLAAIVVLTVLSAVRRMTPRKGMVIGLGVLTMAVAVPLGLATLKERFGEYSLVTDENERAAFERAARAMIADHPYGVGANLYVTRANADGYSERAGVAWNRINRSVPVHNGYLLARAEAGWLGLLAMIAILVAPVLLALKLSFGQRKGGAPGIALGSAVAVSAVAAHSFFEYAFHVAQPQALIFVNMAIIAGVSRAVQLDRKARRRALRVKAAEDEAAAATAPPRLPGMLGPPLADPPLRRS